MLWASQMRSVGDWPVPTFLYSCTTKGHPVRSPDPERLLKSGSAHSPDPDRLPQVIGISSGLSLKKEMVPFLSHTRGCVTSHLWSSTRQVSSTRLFLQHLIFLVHNSVAGPWEASPETLLLESEFAGLASVSQGVPGRGQSRVVGIVENTTPPRKRR